MIHDYKFDRKLRDRTYKPRTRTPLYIGALVIVGALAALGMRDTGAVIPPQDPVMAAPVSTLLSKKAEPELVSLPLAIPGQQPPSLDSVTPAGSDAQAVQADQAPSLLALEIPQSLPLAASPTRAQAEKGGSKTNTAEAERPLATIAEKAVAEEEPTLLATVVAPAVPTQQAVVEAKPRLKKHRISKGETLTGIFEKHELPQRTLFRLLDAGKEAKALSRIRPGQELEFDIDSEGALTRLVLVKNPIESLHFSRKDNNKFAVELKNRKIKSKTASVAGTIQSSLFLDGQKAGLSDNQIMELAEIFGWDIDFALEIRAGDQFRVVYEEQFVDGEKYRNGPILAAEFVNRGKTYQAFRYEDKDRTSYYDADGHSKRRAFIRTPLRFARISSRFQPKRWHPVLKKWKAHKGVDYAAPTGTPIKATGEGRVIFQGWQKGYGRVVIVQHSSKYKTVYAHMSKFRSNVKKGSRVKQGQVIGYVGSSGWATGPHLHYEFRVNNVKRNPLTVDLPKSLPLPKAQLARYKKTIAPLTQKLASIRPSTMVARAGN